MNLKHQLYNICEEFDIDKNKIENYLNIMPEGELINNVILMCFALDNKAIKKSKINEISDGYIKMYNRFMLGLNIDKSIDQTKINYKIYPSKEPADDTILYIDNKTFILNNLMLEDQQLQ